MAPKEPREPEGNKPDQNSPYDETALDKLVDKTQDFLGVNEPKDDQDRREQVRQEPDKEDDFYRPFQHTPGTGPDDVPTEDKDVEEDLTDKKRVIRRTDKRY